MMIPGSAPIKLPELRDGLAISFNDYDPDGKPQWLLHDAGRNKFFVIGWSEYELLERWNLGEANAVINAVNSETTLHIEMLDLEHLVNFLKDNFLLKQSGYTIHQQAREQQLFKNENIIHWVINYYLFFRIPLWHPDKFLTRTKYIANVLFNRYFFYFMSFLGMLALYQISFQWEIFKHTFTTIFTWEGLFFYFISFSICKCCHELGHAYMCKSYGVPVPTFGVAFLVFWPVLYTDTNLSWTLSSKKRLRIALAGIWVETYIAIIAALIWANVHNLTIQSICYITITVTWLSSVLINVSPFMRFDGYYVLTDLLKLPNLQPRAFALTRWQIRRWLFDWPDPPPEKFSRRTHTILVIYSFVTWIYRLTIYLSIAFLVYRFFIKIIGILLFAIEMFYFILRPFVTELTLWYKLREKITWNRHTIATIALTVFAISLFFIPVNTTVKSSGTLSYAHRFLIAPEESILVSALPPSGSKVQANQVIAQLRSPELEFALQKVQLEYKKTLNELRRATINSQYKNETTILLSDIAKEMSENQRLLQLQDTLSLRVPFSGVLIDVISDLQPGSVIQKNEWLGDVIDPKKTLVEAYVLETDSADIKKGGSAYFYPHNLSDPVIPLKVISIESINANELTCQYAKSIKSLESMEYVAATPCYNSSDFGGKIATMVNEEGDYVPVDSVYRVLLEPTRSVTLSYIQQGTVVFNVTSYSYAQRTFYKLKRILLEQSGF